MAIYDADENSARELEPLLVHAESHAYIAVGQKL